MKLRAWGTSAALALLGLALVEGALRGFWPQPPSSIPLSLFEERGGLVYMRPGVRFRHASSEFDVEVASSALGYRAGVGDDDPASPLWLLGDSIAFGWGVRAPETASARLLQRGEHVLNLAMPGDGIPEYVLRLERLARTGKRPSGVLVALYDNDLTAREAARNGPTDGVRVLRSPSAGGLRGRLRAALAQLHAVRLGWRALRGVGLGAFAERAVGLRAQFEGLLREELAVHRRNYASGPSFAVHSSRLGALARSAAALGAGVCIVRVAGYWTSGGPPTAAALRTLGEGPEDFDFDQLDRALAQRLAADGACYARFPAERASPVAGDYFEWDGHLTAAGHAKLGELLARLSRGLATRTPASAAPAPAKG